MISIKGMDKAAVLKALYDHSHIQGLGFLQAVPEGTVTIEHCKTLLENTGYPYFDYLYGRVIKVDLSGDEFDERLYDRDCGPGAAKRAVNSVRGLDPRKLRGELYFDCEKTDVQFAFDSNHNSLRLRFNGIDGLDGLILEATRLRERMLRTWREAGGEESDATQRNRGGL